MFNSKFSGVLTVLLIVAIVGIIGLIGYFGWSVYSKYYLNTSASDAADAFEQNVGNQNNNKNPDAQEDQNAVQNEAGGGQIGDVNPTNSIYGESGNSGGNNNNSNTYYGYKILGTISIPKIDIKYPILEKATPKAINVAVGYLTGVGINKVGNTVIQGHNLRNGLFFSNLGKLSNGDKIYITGEDGQKITYEVYQVFLASESDSSFYKRDTNGLREITLSTCTDDGSQRIIVLAREVKE